MPPQIQDMVAIRHSASNSDQRTTLILLCEDGSLRIYMANVDNTGYWMSPGLQPQSAITALRPTKKKKQAGKQGSKGRTAGQVAFPVDYFEHCQQSNEVDFGGNDVLQIYNTPQIKQRLNTNGMYIASTKPRGFTIEIMNNNRANTIVGLRIAVGSQAIERAPSYIEIFGRTTQVDINRARWYDLPLTREDSLAADEKMTVFFGQSVDPAGVTMVDSIKVYTKTKESFGWPEDSEEFQESAAKPTASTSLTSQTSHEADSNVAVTMPPNSMDR